jgi:hypothetical protein
MYGSGSRIKYLNLVLLKGQLKAIQSRCCFHHGLQLLLQSDQAAELTLIRGLLVCLPLPFEQDMQNRMDGRDRR